MDPLILVSALLIAALIVLVLVVRSYQERVSRLNEELQDSAMARRRAAESNDRLTRSWAPVISQYPFDPRRFRFVGGPVDGLQFEDDRVVFISFVGTGRAPADGRVRDLVRAGRVEWVDVPLGPQEAPTPLAPPAPAPVVADTEPAMPTPPSEPTWPPLRET